MCWLARARVRQIPHPRSHPRDRRSTLESDGHQESAFRCGTGACAGPRLLQGVHGVRQLHGVRFRLRWPRGQGPAARQGRALWLRLRRRRMQRLRPLRHLLPRLAVQLALMSRPAPGALRTRASTRLGGRQNCEHIARDLELERLCVLPLFSEGG